MIRHAVETAVREGIPSMISMANGRHYEVGEDLRNAAGSTNVVVLDERDCPHAQPLLTMAGLASLPKPNESSKS